jgi:DNA invertase Pin-like site-specific DNA recombinase
MNHLFGYARVSTADQNLDTQLSALQQIGCHEIFQDKITGTSTSRPALDELLTKLRPGDTVVVARFNRLGRSRDHLISLLSDFRERGIQFRALDLGVDSSTPAGKMVLQIFAALAEYDREHILEKTKAGRELAKAKGKHMGRPTGVDPENFVKVKTAFSKGMSAKETVAVTGISLSSVKRYRKLIDNLL